MGASRSAASCRSPRRATPRPSKRRLIRHDAPAGRRQRDEALRTKRDAVGRVNYEGYGVRKVWHQRRQDGEPVARCTLGRLMRAAGLMRTDLVLDALEQALHDRETDAGRVCHSARGSQYVSMRYTERLAAAGVAPSVGRVGDAYDNALAESVIGLFTTEVIHRRGPWKGFGDVEYATREWVAWFNQQRLLEPLGYLPPAVFEEPFYRAQTAQAELGTLN
jgi:transposase InsO family protein